MYMWSSCGLYALFHTLLLVPQSPFLQCWDAINVPNLKCTLLSRAWWGVRLIVRPLASMVVHESLSSTEHGNSNLDKICKQIAKNIGAIWKKRSTSESVLSSRDEFAKVLLVLHGLFGRKGSPCGMPGFRTDRSLGRLAECFQNTV